MWCRIPVILVLGRLRQDGCHIGSLATDAHPDLECDTQTWYTTNTHTPTKNNLESRAHSLVTSLVLPCFLSLVFIISSFSASLGLSARGFWYNAQTMQYLILISLHNATNNPFCWAAGREPEDTRDKFSETAAMPRNPERK